MRTNKTKEEFINDIHVKIETRKNVLNIYENFFLPLVKKFDGKVLNKRFKTQFDKLLKENNIDNVLLSNRDCFYRLDKKNYRVNDSDVESLFFQFVLIDGRIDFYATISEDVNRRNLNGFKDGIRSYERCVNNYDKYMQIAKETEKKIKEFNNQTHYLFKKSIKIDNPRN